MTRSRFAEIHDDLADLAQNWAGLDAEQARAFADRVAARLVERYGGQTYYVPETPPTQQTTRDRRVLEALAAGQDRRVVCRQFSICERTIYRIQARARDGQ